MTSVQVPVVPSMCVVDLPATTQSRPVAKPGCEVQYVRLQTDSLQVKPAPKGVIPTLQSTGAGAVAGMLAGSAISVIPMLASTENMSGLYVIAGAAAGLIGGALAGGMHGNSVDAKASAASAAIIGGVLGGTMGLFSGGVKGALVGGAMAASIGASGAFAGSAIHQGSR